MKTLVMALVCSVVVGSSVMARAEEQPLDTVVTQDGALVRGRVVELVPQQRIVLQTATGETRTIEWAQVARTDGPSFAPIGAPAPVAVPTAVPTAIVVSDPLLTPGPGRVPLLVESTGRELRVGEPTGSGTGYGTNNTVISVQMGRTVCSTPCTLHVAPGSVPLWVQGEGQRTQLLYPNVPPEGGAVRVRPSSAWGRFGGVLLFSTGLMAAGGGGTLLYFGVNNRVREASAYVDRPDNGMIGGGAALTVASVPLLVGGILLLYKNRGGIESQRSYAAHASR